MTKFEETLEEAQRVIKSFKWSEDDPIINLQWAVERLVEAVEALGEETKGKAHVHINEARGVTHADAES